MAHPNTAGEYAVGVGAGLVPGQQMPLPQDLDVTVLASAMA